MKTRFDQLITCADSWADSLPAVFSTDPSRARRFVIEACGVRFDYSKHWINDDIKATLLSLLRSCDFEKKRIALFSGQPINYTEDRPALHSTLRVQSSTEYQRHGESFALEVLKVRGLAYRFAEEVRNGKFKGVTGKIFTDVLNIGIGGSSLGPSMVNNALRPWIDGPTPHFVSNVDGSHLHDTIAHLDPETTLVLVVSKTFTTQETMHNAEKAKRWIESHLGDQAIPLHFAAISADREKAKKFGLDNNRIFEIWDCIGGRFSVWSSIGLSVILSIGPECFDQFLQGAHAMDQHFKDAPADVNIPVLMALLGVWYRNGFGFQTHAILPYDQRLAELPTFLQQIEMESNGKQTNSLGENISYNTCPVIWGSTGTNGQHAFYQLLHQGTVISPMDFLLAAQPVDSDIESHQLLIANCLAQSESLAFGKAEQSVLRDMLNEGLSLEEARRLAPHCNFPGNRPSSLFTYEQLTPYALGTLIAAYEHKVFTQGILWDVNSFDQWGVELGKAQCNELFPTFASGDAPQFSTATREAMKWLKSRQI